MADFLYSPPLTAFSFYSPKCRLEVKKYIFFFNQLLFLFAVSILPRQYRCLCLLRFVRRCREERDAHSSVVHLTKINCLSQSVYDSRSDQIPSTVHVPTIPCCQVLLAIQEKAIKLIMTFAFSFLGEKKNKSHYFILQELYPEIFKNIYGAVIIATAVS